MAPLAVYQSSEERTRARAGNAGNEHSGNVAMSLQALPIDFNSILQIAIEAIKAYDRNEPERTQIEIGIEVRAQAWALTMSVPTRYCNLVSRLGLAWLAPRGTALMRDNMQSKAKHGRAERKRGRETRQVETFEPKPKLCLCLCGCNTLQASCPLRSTEAAASNDCYYIYRLGHYNKISKYLVIIQFESCHKSGCKRATVLCSGCHTSSSPSCYTYCRLLVICQLRR